MNDPLFSGDWADFRARMILIEMFGEFENNRGPLGHKDGREFVRTVDFREATPLVRTIAGHLRATALAGPCLPSCNHPAPLRRHLTGGDGVVPIHWCGMCGAYAFDGTEHELVWNMPLGRIIPPSETP